MVLDQRCGRPISLKVPISLAAGSFALGILHRHALIQDHLVVSSFDCSFSAMT